MKFEETKIALNVRRPVRSVIRSDGKAKVYGWSEDGKLLTVTMQKNTRGDYDVTEIKLDGEYTYFK